MFNVVSCSVSCDILPSFCFPLLHLLQLCNNSGGQFGAREGINSKATSGLVFLFFLFGGQMLKVGIRESGWLCRACNRRKSRPHYASSICVVLKTVYR